jgi:hypothetical protein
MRGLDSDDHGPPVLPTAAAEVQGGAVPGSAVHAELQLDTGAFFNTYFLGRVQIEFTVYVGDN